MGQGLFVSRVEAESTTLGELLERYFTEITPSKKGAGPESARIRALLRHPLALILTPSPDFLSVRSPDFLGPLDQAFWLTLNRCIALLPDTKDGESRTVPLSSIAIRVLRALPRSLHGEVFPGLTTEAVKRAYIRAVSRAGIEGLRFHDLRHEATIRLFEKGLNIMEVASITGHKDLRMLRRYTHLKAEDLARKLG